VLYPAELVTTTETEVGVVDAAAVEYVTVPVSEMRTPVRLYAAAQAERDRP
jgi:hypothetical protein